jgi:hypothetical protein
VFWGSRKEEMANKGAKKTCEGCSRWKEVKSKMRIATLLGEAAESFAAESEGERFRPTLAEYLKLIQLEKEFEEEEVKEIKVTWVEPTSSAPKKSK